MQTEVNTTQGLRCDLHQRWRDAPASRLGRSSSTRRATGSLPDSHFRQQRCRKGGMLRIDRRKTGYAARFLSPEAVFHIGSRHDEAERRLRQSMMRGGWESVRSLRRDPHQIARPASSMPTTGVSHDCQCQKLPSRIDGPRSPPRPNAKQKVTLKHSRKMDEGSVFYPGAAPIGDDNRDAPGMCALPSSARYSM
jgi:hypothetical protein